MSKSVFSKLDDYKETNLSKHDWLKGIIIDQPKEIHVNLKQEFTNINQ